MKNWKRYRWEEVFKFRQRAVALLADEVENVVSTKSQFANFKCYKINLDGYMIT